MNRKLMLILVVAVILIGGVVVGITLFSGSGGGDEHAAVRQEGETQLWTCGMHPEVILEEPGNCPKCGMKLVPVKNTGGSASQQSMDMSGDKSSGKDSGGEKGERKILYWQAPMDPTEIYDHPGKSKMGMDLVPVYADQAGKSAGGAVTIDPVTQQNMGVRMTTVKKMDFSRNIRAVANIDYNEEKLYTINSKISGWIEKLYVNYTGEMVRKGAPLLEIYSPDLVTTQEEYLLALKNKEATSNSQFQSIKEGANSLLASTRKRFQNWDVPEAEIRRLEKTGEVKKTIRMKSPANGVVLHKNAVEGIRVNKGMDLYRIADLSTVWVEASIYDYELPWISEGSEARMELSYTPDETYHGKVVYIYPYLDKKARDVKVRLEFPNPDLKLKPGMYANVIIEGKVIPGALVIPSEAIIRSGQRDIVFVSLGDGKFAPREIKTGPAGGPNNEYVQVLSGLLEGDRVVTSAQFMLDSESRLQTAIQKMLEEKKNNPAQKNAMDSMENMDNMSSNKQKMKN